MKILCLVLILVVIFSVQAAYNNHFLYGTSGQEVVYKYVTEVKAFETETNRGSEYVFKADLHLRLDENGNGTYAYFVNPGIFLSTGPVKGMDPHRPEPEFTSIIKESEDILKPFYFSYDHFGLVREIFFQEGDPTWSMNLKKGVATALQLDFEELYKYPTTQPFAFHTEESSPLGNVNVSYAVVPHENYYRIIKTTEATPDYTGYEYSNIEHIPYKEHPVLDSYHPYHTYEVEQSPNGHLVRKIFFYENRHYVPFFRHSFAMIVSSNQSFVYSETLKPAVELDRSSFKIYQTLLFQHDEQYYPDYSIFPPNVDMAVIRPKVYALFLKAYEYLQMNPLSKTPPDTEHGLTISIIVEQLKPFTVENYQNFYSLLTKSVTPKDLMILDLFYRVLPTVGTRYSVAFIKNLILKQKMKEYIACNMLYALGSNVRIPSVDILKELEVFFVSENEVKPEVSHAAILTFGTLVYKTFRYNPESPELEKYIKLYYNKLKTANSYEDQLVWLHGLENIRIGSVYKLVLPIVKGEQVLEFPYDRHLRLHAINLISQSLRNDHKQLYDYVWPVFGDVRLPTELRVAALRTILRMNDLTYTTSLFWHMQTEQNPHLFSYYYSYYKSISESDIKKETPFYEYTHHIIDYWKRFSTVVDTRFFQFDYVDPETKFGGAINGHFIAEEKYNRVNQIYLQLSPYIMDSEVNLYAIYVKYEGIENPLAKLWPKLFTFRPDILKDKPVKSIEKVPVHVEILLMANGKIVYAKTYNDDTIKSFYSQTYLSLLTTAKYFFTNIFNAVDYEYYMPTAVGIPIKYYTHIPLVTYFKHDLSVGPSTDAAEVLLKMASFLRLWSTGVYSISIYNPFAHAWHGVQRVNAFDMNIPLYFDLGFNFAQQTMKLTLTKGLTDAYNNLGFKTHVKSEVYVYPVGEVDYLKKTCASCQHYTPCTYGEKYRTESILYDIHSKDFGLHQYIGLYDVEVYPYMKVYKSFSDLFTNYHYTYDKSVSYSKYFATFFAFFMNTFLPPKPISYGFIAMVHPSTIYPVEKAEFVYRTNLEELKHMYWTVPSYKMNTRFGATFKGPTEKIMSQWDFNAIVTHEHGYYFKDFSVQAFKTTPNEKNLNICFERYKIIGEDVVNGTFRYYQGYSNERKCVRDDFAVSFDWAGTYSPDQKKYTYDPRYTYPECTSYGFTSYDHYPLNLECASAHASLRKYTYKINYQNVPSYFYNFLYLFYNTFKVSVPYYYVPEPYYHVSSNSMKVDVTYPIYYDEPYIYVAITSPEKSEVFEHVPYYNWMWFFQPETPYITRYFKFMKSLGLVHSCAIYPQETVPIEYNTLNNELKTSVPSEWTLYASDKPTDYTWAIFAKKFTDESYISIKLVLNGHEIYISPNPQGVDSKYEFQIDDKLLNHMQSSHLIEDSYSYKLFNINNAVLLTMPHISLYVVYDGHHIVVEVPKEYQFGYHGACFE